MSKISLECLIKKFKLNSCPIKKYKEFPLLERNLNLQMSASVRNRKIIIQISAGNCKSTPSFRPK